MTARLKPQITHTMPLRTYFAGEHSRKILQFMTKNQIML